MRVALTGATGFIGSHVLAELQGHGHEVTALVRDDTQADVVAARGATPAVVDLYDTPAVVKPGETLTTTCTFNNTTSAAIAFGTVSEAEMCYNFVVAYPAKALHNPGNSIEGALNTCLQ